MLIFAGVCILIPFCFFFWILDQWAKILERAVNQIYHIQVLKTAQKTLENAHFFSGLNDIPFWKVLFSCFVSSSLGFSDPNGTSLKS